MPFTQAYHLKEHHTFVGTLLINVFITNSYNIMLQDGQKRPKRKFFYFEVCTLKRTVTYNHLLNHPLVQHYKTSCVIFGMLNVMRDLQNVMVFMCEGGAIGSDRFTGCSFYWYGLG